METEELQKLFEEWYITTESVPHLKFTKVVGGYSDITTDQLYRDFCSMREFIINKEAAAIAKTNGVYSKFMDSDGNITDPKFLENILDRLDDANLSKSYLVLGDGTTTIGSELVQDKETKEISMMITFSRLLTDPIEPGSSVSKDVPTIPIHTIYCTNAKSAKVLIDALQHGIHQMSIARAKQETEFLFEHVVEDLKRELEILKQQKEEQ